MSLPFPANTTCDVYRNGRTPPATPDVEEVPCSLQADYARGRQAAAVDATIGWTHVLLVPLATDVRDGWDAGVPLQVGAFDSLYVPDQDGTRFSVLFVERIGRGTQADCKRVYLRREQPVYPTNEV